MSLYVPFRDRNLILRRVKHDNCARCLNRHFRTGAVIFSRETLSLIGWYCQDCLRELGLHKGQLHSFEELQAMNALGMLSSTGEILDLDRLQHWF